MIFALASTSAQYALPTWMGARGMSLFQIAMFGGLAAGSVGWGALSDAVGLPVTLLVAAGTAVALGVLGLRFHLNLAEGRDLSPADDMPAHVPLPGGSSATSPVLVRIRYELGTAGAKEVAAMVRGLRTRRLREGAFGWILVSDPDGGALEEEFTAANWTDHEREMERLTKDDSARIKRIDDLLKEKGGRRTVRHLIAPALRESAAA